jgi:hypothetical protein
MAYLDDISSQGAVIGARDRYTMPMPPQPRQSPSTWRSALPSRSPG